jgi:hypothetical protein
MLSGLSPSGAAPQVLFMALALGAVGLVQFFRLQRRRRVMEDMPTARIRSAAQGYVELIGRALPPDAPLFSPITRTPCCWYRYKIEKRDDDNKNSWSSRNRARARPSSGSMTTQAAASSTPRARKCVPVRATPGQAPPRSSFPARARR